ncbi:MAG: hypothetical protein A2X36_04755 [Elusimicrobia bacterium GWA2_69_24]|nr:MAG: hypothetical protein A2X36_04755 [Elusimicrobia bacterium GWA2_69_24]HBL17519.1 hypothetical protein [Elusimicrobiota bacterium]
MGKALFLGSAALVLWASPARGADPGYDGPLVPGASVESPAVPTVPDTAGTHLREVWMKARTKHRDALLISISARTQTDGTVLCDPKEPFQKGWLYTFFSPKATDFVMMAECQGEIGGPLKEFVSKDAGALKWSVSGKFLDSDGVMGVLKKNGISLDPREYGGGKTPFLLTLYRLSDPRFEAHPPVWTVVVGAKTHLIDAVNDEVFKPERFGVSLDETELSSSTAQVSKALNLRPKRDGVFTAKQDLERVLRYAQEKLPQSSLMAIEGFVDAWGGSPCTGPGDGWLFYFYSPRIRDYETVYACNGYVGPGPSRYVPVDMDMHEPITGRFIDSDRVIDSVLTKYGDVMNEGLGRSYKRTGTLLLRHYRVTPFDKSAMFKIRMLWELTLGRSRFRIDALTGKVVDMLGQ